MEEIRVRFAPSPTGTLHIGGARTALFNWLFARSQGGKFILRLEDTDVTRSTDESASGIIEGLSWLGLDWDEGPERGGLYGPYRQSERLHIYKDYAQKLLEEDKAYYCFCSPEELKLQREKAQQDKTEYKYDGRCRCLSHETIKSFLAEGKRPVLRIKVPESGSTVVKDLIRGRVEFSNRLLDDFIIVKSDGWPTYNFAVVIDDATMKISHVIRAEEHLSNTPKQLLLYEALGFNIPEFAHVSMILAPDRSKLSKRHGATSVQEFRDEGYLPEALINYLALLGWSSGEDTDFWSLQALAQSFNLNNVSRSAAIYDLEKLKWMNGHYLSKADPERLLAWITHNGREQDYLNKFSRTYILEVVKLLQNRLKTLDEFFNEASYFFFAPEVYDEKGVSKYFAADNSNEILIRVLALIEEINPFNAANLENALRSEADKMNLKAAQLIHPTRLALSGKTNTPGLFEVMELLGREACTDRVKRAISYLYHNR